MLELTSARYLKVLGNRSKYLHVYSDRTNQFLHESKKSSLFTSFLVIIYATRKFNSCLCPMTLTTFAGGIGS